MLFALASSFCVPAFSAGAVCSTTDWLLWQTFQKHFVLSDGRVLDASTPERHSSSEGMSYAMFFALVANDKQAFNLLWRWSVNNLAAGDMTKNLPAWFWGLDNNGNWRVLDKNSASDADLWFAYALLEAGRLWKRDDYTQAAMHLLRQVAELEVADLPGLGKMLMPGIYGFTKPERGKPHSWQINPSYMPIPLLRRFAEVDSKGPWEEIAVNTAKLMQMAGRNGFIADWVSYRATGEHKGQFIVDPTKGDLGSYDAIRTYLWAGVTSKKDPLASPMLKALTGMVKPTLDSGYPPEKVQTATGQVSGVGPFGFSVALLPYFKALYENRLFQQQSVRVQNEMALTLTPEAIKAAQPPYYYFVLSLFSLGFIDNRYHFSSDGKLQPIWEKTCQRAVKQ